MAEKHEWRKQEKYLYLPKNRSEVIDVPVLNYITLRGEGSPDEALFAEIVSTLYSLAYAIKMYPKKMVEKPEGYFDFTVYPLEGIWDINEKARKTFTGQINKKDLVYQLMIRQPDFVDKNLFSSMLKLVQEKKPNPLLTQVQFESIAEGKCIQMLHVGKYENEPVSFEAMEVFAATQGLTRLSKVHREIYLTDVRKTAPEKLKTVLRFKTI